MDFLSCSVSRKRSIVEYMKELSDQREVPRNRQTMFRTIVDVEQELEIGINGEPHDH
jgi:hypothetical protein